MLRIQPDLIAYHYMLQMLTTAGGDVPANFFELGFFMLVIFASMTVYAAVVGNLSSLVMKQDDDVVLKRAQLELVGSYISHIRVPRELKQRIKQFFLVCANACCTCRRQALRLRQHYSVPCLARSPLIIQFMRTPMIAPPLPSSTCVQMRVQATSLSAIPPEAVFNGLPMELQVEVAAHTNKAVVDAAALLRGTSQPFAERLAAMLHLRQLDAETIIHRTAEACTELIFVAAGVVEVTRRRLSLSSLIDVLHCWPRLCF